MGFCRWGDRVKMKMAVRRNWEGEVKVEKGVKFMVLVTNMVAVARHGLISEDGEATRSRKVLKYLPGHREAKKKSKNIDKVEKS